jgi:glycosyltransferase involved in cell wall biosynthesis
MKIALIEPYLVDYAGHYYNFVTELRRGFNEIDNKDVVDVFVSKKCTLDEVFFKVLPEVKNLKKKDFFVKIFKHISFLLRFYKALMKIEKNYDILVFTTADGFRLLLLLCNMSFKKQIFLYSHHFFSEKKQKFILKFAKHKRDRVYFLSPFSRRSENASLIESLQRKGFNLILDAPYPFRRLNNSGKKQSFNIGFCILHLGPARKEKGFIETIEFIRFCKRNQLDYEFILQCSGAYDPEVKEYIRIVKNEHFDKVELIEQPLSQPEYEKTMQKSLILLLLYDPTHYIGAISGILLEALSMSKPVVVRSGTWLADQVQKYGGGIVISELNPENIKAAIEKIRFNYEKFSAEAFEAGEELSKRHNGKELARLIKSLAVGESDNLSKGNI